jgi:uncharacterized Zn finger protein
MANRVGPVGTPEKRGVGWYVPSGKVGYFVEWLPEGRWRCTCPSFGWFRKGMCKHISAVMVSLQEQRGGANGAS